MAKSRRASPCPAYPTLTHQDVNLKMPRNNQLLHFAFREDKQWKLQQVIRPFPSQGLGHRIDRSRPAQCAKASRDRTLEIFCHSKPDRVFPSREAGVGGAWASEPSLVRGEPFCMSPGLSQSHRDPP